MPRHGGASRRYNVRLDPAAEAALEEMRHGLSYSRAIREAVLLAHRLQPVVERLDRIEAALAQGAVPVQVPVPKPDVDMQAVLRNVMGSFASEDQ